MARRTVARSAQKPEKRFESLHPGAPNPEDYPGSELVDWSAGDAVNAFQSSDDDLAFLRGTASSCSNFDEVTLQEVFGPVERPN